MLSRVAESIYWMTRYIGRAESYARFIGVNQSLIMDAPRSIEEQWTPLIFATGDFDHFNELYSTPTRENVISYLVSDTNSMNSIVSCIRMARENAMTVREAISTELWEHINQFYQWSREQLSNPAVICRKPAMIMDEIKRNCQLFSGILVDTMSRTEGWYFAVLGRNLERADKTTRMLDVKYFLLLPDVEKVGTPLDLLQWTAILRSMDAYQVYQKTHGRITPANIIQFLILDNHFPRSIHFCLHEAHHAIRRISRSLDGNYVNKVDKQLGFLKSKVGYTDVEDIFNYGLHEYLDQMQVELNLVGDAIREAYFSPALNMPAKSFSLQS